MGINNNADFENNSATGSASTTSSTITTSIVAVVGYGRIFQAAIYRFKNGQKRFSFG